MWLNLSLPIPVPCKSSLKMADVESTRPRRAKGLFTPSPSLQELKTPQRFVTIILSIVCIVSTEAKLI